MQNEGAIRQKLKQVRFRHQKKLIQAHLDARPCNCRWNSDLAGPADESVGSCLHSLLNPLSDDKAPFQVCDERLDKGSLARGCPYFEPLKEVDEIKEDFDAFLKTATLGKIAENYPDMAALMWCLVGSAEEAGLNLEPDATLALPPPPQEMTQKSWLRRLWEGAFA